MSERIEKEEGMRNECERTEIELVKCGGRQQVQKGKEEGERDHKPRESIEGKVLREERTTREKGRNK